MGSSGVSPVLPEWLAWQARTAGTFFRVVPGSTLAVTAAVLVAQVALLFAFFLPLKVIILLGSERIPRYFPEAMATMDYSTLVVGLAAASIGFYGIYLLAERLAQAGSERGARKLLARNAKLALFENQDDVAAKAYADFTGMFASAVFVIVAFFGVAWLYPAVAWLLAAFIVFVTAVLSLAGSWWPAFRGILMDRLQPWLLIAAGVGFMGVFAFVVVDFLFRKPPALIPAIIGLLLARQILRRAAAVVTGSVSLFSRRSRIDALFSTESVLHPEMLRRDPAIWPLLLPQRREVWVRPLVSELTGIAEADIGRACLTWWPSGVRDTGLIRCSVPGSDHYLVKLFERNQTRFAVHEEMLLRAVPEGFPCPRLVGVGEFAGLRCHVLGLPSASVPASSGNRAMLEALEVDLLAVEPPSVLADRFSRSRPPIWERLPESLLERPFVAAKKPDLPALEEFRARGAEWRRRLSAIPLAIVNPDQKLENAAFCEGRALLIHWGRWSLEPCGAGWSTDERKLAALETALGSARLVRPSLGEVDHDSLVLSALSFELEKLLQGQRLTEALELMPRIVGSLDRLARPVREDRFEGKDALAG